MFWVQEQHGWRQRGAEPGPCPKSGRRFTKKYNMDRNRLKKKPSILTKHIHVCQEIITKGNFKLSLNLEVEAHTQSNKIITTKR